MMCFSIRFLFSVILFASGFAIPQANGGSPTRPAPHSIDVQGDSTEELPAPIYRIVTPSAESTEIVTVQPQFTNAVDSVRWLAQGRDDWENYLKLSRLSGVAASPGSEDLSFIEKTVKRLTQDYPGLCHREMLALRKSSQTLSQQLRRQKVTVPRYYRDAVDDAVSDHIDNDPETLAKANAAWRWLVDHGKQTRVPRAALDQSPDVRFWVRADSLGTQHRTEHSVDPVQGFLRGVAYRGQAITGRRVSVTPMASVQTAAFAINVQGNSQISTSSASQGVYVRSDSEFRFDAAAALHLTPTGWTGSIDSLHGDYRSQPTSISVSRNKWFKRRRRKRAAAEHHAGIGEAKQQSLEQLRADFSNEVQSVVGSLNRTQSEVMNRLLRLDHLPTTQHYSSDGNGISGWVRLTEASPAKITSPTPPVLNGKAVLQIHDSAFNSLISMMLPQGSSDFEHIRDRLSSFADDSERPSKEQESLETILPFRSPVECFFRDGQVTVLLHTKKLSTTAKTLGETDIRFSLAPQGGGTLQRQGKVTLENSSAFPPPKQVGLRGISARRIIGNVVSQQFPETIDVTPFVKSALAETPFTNSHISSMSAADGWLTIVLN